MRKATSDYESQNAVLQRHVDSLHAAVNRLESENNQQRTINQALQRHLESLRTQLVGCFATIPLPGKSSSKVLCVIISHFLSGGYLSYLVQTLFTGIQDGATMSNIDNYFEKLESILTGNAEQSLRNAVRNAVTRLELIG